MLSGAFCSGLIEAGHGGNPGQDLPRYPGHFAPASLKPLLFEIGEGVAAQLSGAFCSGLIEAWCLPSVSPVTPMLSGAFCSGLIEA